MTCNVKEPVWNHVIGILNTLTKMRLEGIFEAKIACKFQIWWKILGHKSKKLDTPWGWGMGSEKA